MRTLSSLPLLGRILVLGARPVPMAITLAVTLGLGAELGLLGLVVPVVNGASTADSSAVFALPSLVIAFRILAGSFGSDGGVLEGARRFCAR